MRGPTGDLVFAGRLPREPRVVIVEPVFRQRGPAGIRSVEGRVLRRIVELVGRLPLVAPLAERAVEPQPVFLDRTTQRAACRPAMQRRIHQRLGEGPQSLTTQ